MHREHFYFDSGTYGTILLVEDGATIELTSTLHIDGVGRWGWAVCDGEVEVREVSVRGRLQLHEITMHGSSTVSHYRIDERGHVVSVRIYHSSVDE
jgi:hypothetical protein